MIEVPLIFGETNFKEVPKIHEIRKICKKGDLRMVATDVTVMEDLAVAQLSSLPKMWVFL